MVFSYGGTIKAMEEKGVKDGMESCKESKRMSNVMWPGSAEVIGFNEQSPIVRSETRLKNFI